ncbi:hypothetical protein BHECKSOX_116 [Bathymodiolus heckerae thiotrophic gill symbiont]|uniref:SIR2 family protein n=1 Tax=Bathymodiolus heckerae thiotrophic gill symbiont TaxID=1052212 RepID=UPI0010B468E9|nr:SIR2 family protein [Bathymodiolus heckerae thiotrophic gill symbiont]SHN92066.1 hypothetical protein BHECKSOX_116 [Bathymodiolus heckerae thiotrophic gill symbiont]
MARILFIGNGLNLVSDGGASWNSLLNRLAGDAKTQHEEMVRKAKPFTLWFEEIKNSSKKRNLNELVSESLVKELSSNKHHVDVMELGFQHILTTNYDYSLEEATGAEWKLNKPAQETTYSLFRRYSLGDRHIWHIHGDIGAKNSIMLGHEQYSKYIQKIRNFLTIGVSTKVKERNGRAYLSKYSGKKVKTKGDVETWVDLFLEHDVHIVGFSFDYTENHLWNLLMEKQKLRKKGVLVGQTIFHRCSDTKQSVDDEAKLSILSAFGVEIVDHTYSSFSEAYDKCIQSLSLE